MSAQRMEARDDAQQQAMLHCATIIHCAMFHRATGRWTVVQFTQAARLTSRAGSER
jgi:hypothetical protein